MPAHDMWNRLLTRWKGNRYKQEFMTFEPENRSINYHRNPVAGVDQIGELLKSVRDRLELVSQPALIIGVDDDQVIDAASAHRVYKAIGSKHKELLQVPGSIHNVMYGNRSGVESRVREAIASFLLSNLR
jgi:esterase/lipase